MLKSKGKNTSRFEAEIDAESVQAEVEQDNEEYLVKSTVKAPEKRTPHTAQTTTQASFVVGIVVQDHRADICWFTLDGMRDRRPP